MTLNETCTALYDHLNAWYHERKTEKEADGKIKPLSGVELRDKKNEFMSLHPECKEYEFDIYYDFVAVEGSYVGGCWCGDCDTRSHVTVKGVRVRPVDWNVMNDVVHYKANEPVWKHFGEQVHARRRELVKEFNL